MELECLRLLKAMLEDPNEGLNATLPLVPRWPGDPAPQELVIGEESAHGWVARMKLPSEKLKQTPLLALAIAEDIDFVAEETAQHPSGEVRQTIVPIALVWAKRITASEDGVQDWFYTRRALCDVIVKLFRPEPEFVARRQSQTGVSLLQLAGMRSMKINPEEGDPTIVRGMIVQIEAIETVAGYSAP